MVEQERLGGEPYPWDPHSGRVWLDLNRLHSRDFLSLSLRLCTCPPHVLSFILSSDLFLYHNLIYL
jgi:hypothetical protein